MKVEPIHTNTKQAHVQSCPRCGGEHEAMIFEPLSNPDDERDWFGYCTEGAKLEPVLVKGSELG